MQWNAAVCGVGCRFMAYVASRPPAGLKQSHLSEERVLAKGRHRRVLTTDEDFHGAI